MGIPVLCVAFFDDDGLDSSAECHPITWTLSHVESPRYRPDAWHQPAGRGVSPRGPVGTRWPRRGDEWMSEAYNGLCCSTSILLWWERRRWRRWRCWRRSRPWRLRFFLVQSRGHGRHLAKKTSDATGVTPPPLATPRISMPGRADVGEGGGDDSRDGAACGDGVFEARGCGGWGGAAVNDENDE